VRAPGLTYDPQLTDNWKDHMRRLFVLTLLCAGLASPNANAKEIDPTRQDPNQLRNADSFAVECESDQGVIGRVGVDVDAATITVEMPGRAPEVHPITKFQVWSGDSAPDRFGKSRYKSVHLMYAFWGTGEVMFGVVRVTDKVVGARWDYLPGDTTVWPCAN
jgi:hypothetical protein